MSMLVVGSFVLPTRYPRHAEAASSDPESHIVKAETTNCQETALCCQEKTKHLTNVERRVFDNRFPVTTMLLEK